MEGAEHWDRLSGRLGSSQPWSYLLGSSERKGDPMQAVPSLWGTVPPHLNAVETRDGASDMASSELSQAQGPVSMSHQDQKGVGPKKGLESKVQQGSTAHPGDRTGNNSIRMWLSSP